MTGSPSDPWLRCPDCGNPIAVGKHPNCRFPVQTARGPEPESTGLIFQSHHDCRASWLDTCAGIREREPEA